MALEAGFKGLCAFVRDNSNLANVTLTTVLMVTSELHPHNPVLAIPAGYLADEAMADVVIETTTDFSDYKTHNLDTWAIWNLKGKDVIVHAKSQAAPPTPGKVTFEGAGGSATPYDWRYVIDLGSASRPDCRSVLPAHLSATPDPKVIGSRVLFNSGHLAAGNGAALKVKFKKAPMYNPYITENTFLTINDAVGVELTIKKFGEASGQTIKLKKDARVYFSNLPSHVQEADDNPYIQHFMAYWALCNLEDCRNWGDMPEKDLSRAIFRNAIPVACPPVDLGP